jgi:gentisate 1,2-dioxygenase
VKGDYAFEIGGEKFRLTAGDTMFAPRNVTHGWANVGDEPGTLLLVSPAGTFEEFLHETTRHSALPPREEIERAFAAHNMKVVGPPLDVENLYVRLACGCSVQRLLAVASPQRNFPWLT